jgi:hypothetical protein
VVLLPAGVVISWYNVGMGEQNITTAFEGELSAFVFCHELTKVNVPAEFAGTIRNNSNATIMVDGKPLAPGKTRTFKRWKTTRYKIEQLLAKML